jgi:hypothetical protein
MPSTYFICFSLQIDSTVNTWNRRSVFAPFKENRSGNRLLDLLPAGAYAGWRFSFELNADAVSFQPAFRSVARQWVVLALQCLLLQRRIHQ